MKINLLDLEISSKLKYQMMFFACAFIHTVFFLIFSLSQIYMLMTFNIFSIAIYIVGAYACGTNNFEKHVLKWIIVIYAEITLHAVLATVHLGYDSYFFLYAMVELSISAYMLFFSCDKKIFVRMSLIFAAITVTALAGCQIYLSVRPPFYTLVFDKTLPEQMTNVMRLMNITFCTATIFIFSLLFVIEINLLIRKLNAAYDKLSYTAMHDSLTGLYNRHSLRDFFDSLD
ncbi:MAG: GGDEF domain-containing protein, partial [Oscillospiraceae bacterium]|nr:GGDEF domain-containing protein [Oscillospiraceae bacterium]